MNSNVKKVIIFSILLKYCSAMKFGCALKLNKSFALRDNDENKIYGDKVLPPAVIQTPDQLRTVFNGIQNAVAHVVENNLFNSVGTICKLWRTYKNEPGSKNGTLNTTQHVKEFFRYYRPKFVSDLGGVGILNKILEKFVEDFKDHKDNVHFVSAYGNVPMSFHEEMSQIKEPILPTSFKITRMAGVFKFKIDKKLGYILIVVDPEDGYVSLVKIMDDEFTEKIGGRMSFQKYNSTYPHLIYSKLIYPLSGSYLFNMEKPFCSIVKPIKEELFIPRRYLIKKNARGESLAAVYFDMISKKNNGTKFDDPEFKIILNSVPKESSYVFKFSQYTSRTIRKKLHEAMKSLSDNLGIDENELYKRFMLGQMFTHKPFMDFYLQEWRKANGIADASSSGAAGAADMQIDP